MNHAKLNRLAKMYYRPGSGGESDDDDYQPSQDSQQLFKKPRYSDDTDGDKHTPAPFITRPSALASREANEDIANSGVFDDDLGSQAFLARLIASRGLSPSILYSEEFQDGASDIDNAELEVESQKPELYGSSPLSSPPRSLSQASLYQINVDEYGFKLVEGRVETSGFCPHSAEACRCVTWLFEQHHTLTKSLAQQRKDNEDLVAKNYRQMVRLKRTRNLLTEVLKLCGPGTDAGENEVKWEDNL
ncbi:hypothetical protein F5880DRAFT_1619711, partial [Lentinula raphanica]